MENQEKEEGKVLFPKIQEVIDKRKKEKEQEVLEITQYVQMKKNQAEEKFKASLPYYEEFFFTHGILIKAILIRIMRAWYKSERVIFKPWARLKPIKITAYLHRDFREDNERAVWAGFIGSEKEVSIHLYDSLEKISKLIIKDSCGNIEKEVCLRTLVKGFREFLWPKLKSYKKEYSLAIKLDKKVDFFGLLEKFIIELGAKRRISEKARKKEEAKYRIEEKREKKKQKIDTINRYKKVYVENKSIIMPKLNEVYNFLKSNTNYSLEKPFPHFLYGLYNIDEEMVWEIIHDSELYNRRMDTVIGQFYLPRTSIRSFSFFRSECLINIVLSTSYYEEPQVSFRLRNNRIGSRKEISDKKDLLDRYIKNVTNLSKEKLDEIIDNWLEEFIDNLRTENLKDVSREDLSIESSKFRKEFLEKRTK